MKCREAQYWLYSFQPNAAWPADVVGHLQGCPECQLVQAQLRQIDQEVNKLTTPPQNDAALVQLLERVGATPQAAVPKPAAPAWPWLRYGTYLAGMAAMLTLGVFLGRELAAPAPSPTEIIHTVEVIREKPVDVIHEKIIRVPYQADRSLVALLLKRNARIVQSTEAKERLETLFDMADDCRQHALTLIDQGPRDSLPLTIELYGQILRDGALGLLAQAPLTERPGLERAARVRLDGLSKPIPKSAELPRILEEQQNSLGHTAWAVLELVGKTEFKLKYRTWQRDETGPPALTLVRYAIAVCSEPDAMVRADFCAHSVQRLMPYMMLCLADEAAAERADMGQQFGELIRFGIYRPIEVATAKEPPQPVQQLAARIVEETDQAVEAMEKQLKSAPANTRAVFEQTLKAIQKSDRPKGKGKSAKDKKKAP